MKKLIAIAFLLMLPTLVVAQTIGIAGFVSMLQQSQYVPPEKNLIVVEVINGVPVEKRLAESADLFFSRALRTKAIFGTSGITAYEQEFVLSLQNVSDRDLLNISILESIPKTIIADAAMIESDENFMVLEADPILKFLIRELRMNETAKLSYSITLDLNEGERISEEEFRSMPVPLALITLEPETCIGIICNDFNPCTRDYCEKGECVFAPVDDGTTCEENKKCLNGQCVEASEFATASTEIDLTAAIITAVVVIAVIFASIVFLRFRKKG